MEMGYRKGDTIRFRDRDGKIRTGTFRREYRGNLIVVTTTMSQRGRVPFTTPRVVKPSQVA